MNTQTMCTALTIETAESIFVYSIDSSIMASDHIVLVNAIVRPTIGIQSLPILSCSLYDPDNPFFIF